MNVLREGQQRGKKGKEIVCKRHDDRKGIILVKNAQSSLHFHFSSSVLTALKLKECTAGQPAAHPDGAPFRFPSLRQPTS